MDCMKQATLSPWLLVLLFFYFSSSLHSRRPNTMPSRNPSRSPIFSFSTPPHPFPSLFELLVWRRPWRVSCDPSTLFVFDKEKESLYFPLLLNFVSPWITAGPLSPPFFLAATPPHLMHWHSPR
ncbi:hypothetical protein B0T26DRAFT_694739 [Lasiosphaeria miniovina]|uniref:Uncharacterized protein n=1 Tax=Lasiosphaeria miniovina TaxID=1954250 RepID=A0AA40B4I7_9PEZI|nr:uncharacterized protein B0T26DRAFT_694739 [Lasiosphaeria miniovina]KAK0727485.1 hypothetical protein B0T26DRAFT_694739 [Lasiosphaeria miniovina]